MIVQPACETAPARAMTGGKPGLPEGVGGKQANLFARWRLRAGWVCAVVLPAAIWFLPEDLSRSGRIALMVLTLAVVGWSVTRIGDMLIGLAAALSLAATGVLSTEKLFGGLGHELIWLLVAAFIIAAVLRASGLLERLLFAILHRLGTVRRLFLGLTGVIAGTAFVLALLLPGVAPLAPGEAFKAVNTAGSRSTRSASSKPPHNVSGYSQAAAPPAGLELH